MSASVRITRSILEHERVAVVASGKVRFIWDSEVKGFGARVQPRSIAFVVDYRHGRFHRRMTFGRLGELRTVEEARRKAAEIKLAVRAGRDPLEEVRAKRKVAERGVTLCAVVEKWTAASRAGWSSDTARLYASTLRKDVLPRFGEREVESITRAEWSDLLTGVRTRAPATATLLRRIIGSVLSWAVDAELLSAVNLPSAKRTAPKVAPRDRVVNDDEIGIIWAATPSLEPRQQAFARFVMLTVVRSGAAALARREWIDARSIRFPGSTLGLKRKTDRRDQDHRVALSGWAWDQIAPVIEDESTLLFSEGQAPIRPTRVLAALRSASGISDWVWHDLRRSFRSWAAKSVVQADAAETVLGHTIHRDEVAKAYQRHKFEDEAEVAFHRWQAHAAQLVGWGFDNYKGPTLKRFLTRAGISRSVGDRFRIVAKCHELYKPGTKEVVIGLGWSLAYELQKLSSSPQRFQQAIAMAKEGTLTKQKLVAMVKQQKGRSSRSRIVVYKVEMDRSEFDALSLNDRNDLDRTCDHGDEIFKDSVVRLKITRQKKVAGDGPTERAPTSSSIH